MIAALACALVLAANPSGQNPYLAPAFEQIQKLDERAALKTLEDARRWPGNGPHELATVWMLTGLAHAGLADEAKAMEAFETALELDPDLELPENLSPTVQEWWAKAKARLPATAERPKRVAPQAPAVAPASPPVEAATAPGPTPAPPSKVERNVGLGLLAAAAATLGTATYFGLTARHLAEAADQEPYGGPAQRLQDDANAKARTATILDVAGAALVGGGAFLVIRGSF